MAVHSTSSRWVMMAGLVWLSPVPAEAWPAAMMVFDTSSRPCKQGKRGSGMYQCTMHQVAMHGHVAVQQLQVVLGPIHGHVLQARLQSSRVSHHPHIPRVHLAARLACEKCQASAPFADLNLHRPSDPAARNRNTHLQY